MINNAKYMQWVDELAEYCNGVTKDSSRLYYELQMSKTQNEAIRMYIVNS